MILQKLMFILSADFYLRQTIHRLANKLRFSIILLHQYLSSFDSHYHK